MQIKAKFSELKTIKPHEYAIRFFFGGLITVLAGLIAKKYGPTLGGLFLAFPAIFPASVTLIEKHEKQKKQKAGYDGTRRAASIEAAGTSIGALGLLLFAFIVYRELPAHNAALVLTAAALAWMLLSAIIWRIRIHGHAKAHAKR